MKDQFGKQLSIGERLSFIEGIITTFHNKDRNIDDQKFYADVRSEINKFIADHKELISKKEPSSEENKSTNKGAFTLKFELD